MPLGIWSALAGCEGPATSHGVHGGPKSGMRGYQWARGVEREEKEGRKRGARGAERRGSAELFDGDILESGLGRLEKG